VKAYLGGGEPSAEGGEAAATTSAMNRDAIGARSASAGDHYQVVVHVDEKSLRGGLGRSDLPIETVKRLTCDGSLITIVEDEHGTPLDVGRKRRTVTTALRRALWSCDRGCSFPGCQRTRYVHAHHIRHWGNGGETRLENLTLLCTYHHALLHEGGFTIRDDERSGIYFRRPDGRVIPRSGYRAADMLDDVAIPLAGENPSAEVRMAAIVHGYELDEDATWNPSAEGSTTCGRALVPERSGNASAEVREERGVYRLSAA
jgi:uncharacterized protein DUF222/HNH endonuclease